VPLMVVGRATEARPAANFHTRCFYSSFSLRTSLPYPILCSSEVGAEFDYCLVSQVKRVIIGARFSVAKLILIRRVRACCPTVSLRRFSVPPSSLSTF
jgi:hypothetical protein